MSVLFDWAFMDLSHLEENLDTLILLLDRMKEFRKHYLGLVDFWQRTVWFIALKHRGCLCSDFAPVCDFTFSLSLVLCKNTV